MTPLEIVGAGAGGAAAQIQSTFQIAALRDDPTHSSPSTGEGDTMAKRAPVGDGRQRGRVRHRVRGIPHHSRGVAVFLVKFADAPALQPSYATCLTSVQDCCVSFLRRALLVVAWTPQMCKLLDVTARRAARRDISVCRPSVENDVGGAFEAMYFACWFLPISRWQDCGGDVDGDTTSAKERHIHRDLQRSADGC
jgi:hypothetical protein